MSVTTDIQAAEPVYPSYATDPVELPAVVADALTAAHLPEVRLATGDRVFLVTRYADCRRVLGDRRFSRNIARAEAAQLLPGVKMPSQPLADPPTHTLWRRALAVAFTARRVSAQRPAVEQIVSDSLRRLESCAPDHADLMEHLAFPVPIAVICGLLQLRPEEHKPFRGLASAALATEASTPEMKAEAFAGLVELSAAIVRGRREHPETDLLSRVMQEEPGLTDAELVATVMTLLIGGYENPAHQIGKMFYALLRHPDQLQQVAADPGRLVPKAVEETLRWVGALDSGFGSPRFALHDVVIGSTIIPAGSTVLVLRQAANRDVSRFDAPDTFDLHREALPHLTFGHGAHHCIGAALARLELEVILRQTVERHPRLQAVEELTSIPWVNRVTASGPGRLLVRLT